MTSTESAFPPKAEKSWTDSAAEKDERFQVLRNILPEMQPQEGSPANTFTLAEIEELKKSLPSIGEKIGTKRGIVTSDKIDIRDKSVWKNNSELTNLNVATSTTTAMSMRESDGESSTMSTDQDSAEQWECPSTFREAVRAGRFRGPTNGKCPGFLQCNLVVLPQGKHAFDFLLFCQRNKKACPLIEVCDVGSPHPSGIANGADLRTDIPKYAIYRDGVLEKEMDDVADVWPEDSVAFLIGCSFSYDGALLEAGIPLRSAEQGKNVPMFRTNIKCRSAGSLSGNMVVSMKPIHALDVAQEAEITSQYPHAHGAPVCIGSPEAIGIEDMNKPDWGDPVVFQPGEIPVFHACGVTPQSILMDSKVPFAITHSAGYMFVTDLKADKVP